MTAPDVIENERIRAQYDRKMARWRAIVDWAKHRPWVLRAISPMTRGRGRWRFVDRWLDRARPVKTPDLTRWNEHALAACWLGHATMLLRVGEQTILIDPVFSTRVGLGWGFGTFGPARVTKPACAIGSLPPVDVILISHAHFDHLDLPTLSRLPRSSTIVCARGLKDLLGDLGFARLVEIDVDESIDLSMTSGRIRITGIEQRHWGARAVIDSNRSYCGFLIESFGATRERSSRVLYGGDTAYQDHWTSIGESGGVDLAIVGIGAYNPWIDGHANPEQAWQMAMHAGARKVLPMHHSTFKLSQEPMEEPLARFLNAAGDRAADVVCRSIGDCWIQMSAETRS